jgi:hypothetical protein
MRCLMRKKTKLQNADYVLENASICVYVKSVFVFMRCDEIRDYIGSIFIDVTSSLENTSLRGGCVIKT